MGLFLSYGMIATSDVKFAADSGVVHPVDYIMRSGIALVFHEQYTGQNQSTATGPHTGRPFRVPQGRPGPGGERTRADTEPAWRFEVVRYG